MNTDLVLEPSALIKSVQKLMMPSSKRNARKFRSSAQATIQPRLLSTARAAIYLGVSVWTVRRLVWSGVLPAHRGRRMRFDVKDLDAWIEKQKRRVI